MNSEEKRIVVSSDQVSKNSNSVGETSDEQVAGDEAISVAALLDFISRTILDIISNDAYLTEMSNSIFSISQGTVDLLEEALDVTLVDTIYRRLYSAIKDMRDSAVKLDTRMLAHIKKLNRLDSKYASYVANDVDFMFVGRDNNYFDKSVDDACKSNGISEKIGLIISVCYIGTNIFYFWLPLLSWGRAVMKKIDAISPLSEQQKSDMSAALGNYFYYNFVRQGGGGLYEILSPINAALVKIGELESIVNSHTSAIKEGAGGKFSKKAFLEVLGKDEVAGFTELLSSFNDKFKELEDKCASLISNVKFNLHNYDELVASYPIATKAAS